MLSGSRTDGLVEAMYQFPADATIELHRTRWIPQASLCGALP
jgi:hypothetical protein